MDLNNHGLRDSESINEYLIYCYLVKFTQQLCYQVFRSVNNEQIKETHPECSHKTTFYLTAQPQLLKTPLRLEYATLGMRWLRKIKRFMNYTVKPQSL